MDQALVETGQEDESSTAPAGHTIMSFQTTERAVVPYPHRLPWRLTWGIHILTSIVMVLLNVTQIYLIKTLVHFKFTCMQLTIDNQNMWLGVMVLVVMSMIFAAACLGVIFGLAPAAAGSGSPENKGWLNGTQKMASMFTWKNMFVRATATMFSNASGFPVGREGPTVTMGSNVAFCLTDFVSSRYVRSRIRRLPVEERAMTLGGDEDSLAAAILERDRFQAAKRNACVVGGACGMTMIFDSPIGGIIYMFEEIGAISWSADLTFSAFTATVLCDVLMRLFLELAGSDMKEWVIFQVDILTAVQAEKAWFWEDVPFFLLVALALGPFSSLHTQLCLAVAGLRQRWLGRLRQQQLGKLLEGVLFAAFCALVATLVASLGGCNNQDESLDDRALELVRFTCAERQYSPVASLLVTTSEAAMRLLISRESSSLDPGDDFFDVRDLVLAFLAYTCINIGLTGIPVPSGNFTGTMLIGGFVGRAAGVLVSHWDPEGDHAKPGVYAMMGSAAMLCGFKRMSMAVVLFIAECGDDWNLIPPLMLSVCTSLTLNRFFLKNGFDEEQMMRKGIHFLHPEPSKTLYGHSAHEFMDDSIRPISSRISAEDLWQLLQDPKVSEVIPIVDDEGLCLGFTMPARLRGALAAAAGRPARARRAGSGSPDFRAPPGASPPLGGLDSGEDLSLELLVDRSPHQVPEEMAAPRVYALFAKTGISHACVVSRRGELRGVITRTSLSKGAKALQKH